MLGEPNMHPCNYSYTYNTPSSFKAGGSAAATGIQAVRLEASHSGTTLEKSELT